MNIDIKTLLPRASQSFLDANRVTLSGMPDRNALQPIVERKKGQTRQSLLPQCQPKDRGYATCVGCGKSFKIGTRSGLAKYCSQPCSARYTGKRTLAKNRRRQVGHSSICRNCGILFHSPPSMKRKFCSMDCAYSNEESMKQRVASFRSKVRPTQYSRTRKGWVETESGKRFFARSGWEAIYAHHLDFLMRHGEIKNWEYEAETFWFDGIKRGVRSYLPDFRVTNTDGSREYHEVKGWMDAKSKTRLRRMAKYHPTVVVILRDSTWFKGK